MDETLLCGIPRFIVFRHKRREGGENHMAKDLDGAFRRFCVFLPELVAIGIAYW